MKDYMEAIRAIDKEALKAKAQVALEHAREYAAEAKGFAGDAKILAADACGDANDFVDFTMDKVRTFSIFDMAIFKICLIAFGMWLGTQFSKFFSKFKIVIFLGFVASWMYLVYRIFFSQTETD